MSATPFHLLQHTVKMMNAFSVVLTDMERAGAKIDIEALDKLEDETRTRHTHLKREIDQLVSKVSGGQHINLDSPEQLSALVYSCNVRNKDTWATIFNIGTSTRGSVKKRKQPRYHDDKALRSIIRKETSVFMQKRPTHCNECAGKGRVSWITKSGERAKKDRKCTNCEGQGYTLNNLGTIAGFKCKPIKSLHATAGGFSTSHDTLVELAERTTNEQAKRFLTYMVEFNALTSYLSTTIAGIRRAVRGTGLLHTNFNQTVAATGRLSSTAPNLHNQPTGNTFPIRRVFVSRWPGGHITKGDFSQLEFRIAVELSGDEQGFKDLAEGIDVHERTRNILAQHGQVGTRSSAKSYTFKPLYGGTTGNSAQKAYYNFFADQYPGISSWHKNLQNTALSTGRIIIPSGRIYTFRGVKRYPSGAVSQSTQIKNYPVQGFATGDIVPIVTIELWRRMKKLELKSLIINEVHDDVVTDTHPEELDIIPQLMYDSMSDTKRLLKHWYNYDLRVELPVEIQQGPNWLDVEEVKL